MMFYHDIQTLGDESNYKSPSGDLGVDGMSLLASTLPARTFVQASNGYISPEGKVFYPKLNQSIYFI